MDKLTFVVLGYGARGHLYSDIISASGDKMQVVAVCEKNPKKLAIAKEKLGLLEENCYAMSSQFFSLGKIADVLIIATQDRDHYEGAMQALDLGYDILLEKPISVSENECRRIAKKAILKNRKVVVCHVLRYTPFYQKIKEVLASGEVGEVVTLSQTENVGYWHQAHSFVRGNWASSEKSCPMILQKCCHDMDIIKWLMNGRCEKVSSFGSLFYFAAKNAPAGASENCAICKLKNTCEYNAIDFYVGSEDWRNMTGTYFGAGDESSVTECFANPENPYGRCVFHCDNDVVDHQVVNMLFENGKTAQLTMTAFSNDFRRTIKLHCTKGEIVGDLADNTIIIRPYKKTPTVIDVQKLCTDLTHHGGGDKMLIADLYEFMTGSESGKGLTTITNSLESHLMAFAAEKSRRSGGKPVTIK